MCNCKGNCDKGYCDCVKKNKLCDDSCNCSRGCTNYNLNNIIANKKRKLYHETKFTYCNCKFRNCIAKYCICRKNNLKCNDKCNCCDCHNNDFYKNIKLTNYYKRRKKTKRIKTKNNNIVLEQKMNNENKKLQKEQKMNNENKKLQKEQKMNNENKKLQKNDKQLKKKQINNESYNNLLDSLFLDKYSNHCEYNTILRKLHEINNFKDLEFISDISSCEINIENQILDLNLF